MDIKILKGSERPVKNGLTGDTYALYYSNTEPAIIYPGGALILNLECLMQPPSDGAALITGDSSLWIDSGICMGTQILPCGGPSKIKLRFQNLSQATAIIYPGDEVAKVNFIKTEGASFTEYSNL